jgi:hypothetical protein
MTEEAADAAVDQACRLLRLPTVLSAHPNHGFPLAGGNASRMAARLCGSWRAML